MQAQPLARPSDLAPIVQVTKRLLGERCWKVSAPMESLYLYLGQKLHVDRFVIGSWQIHTLATPWSLLEGERIRAFSEDLPTKEAMEEKAMILLDKLVTGVEVDYPSLKLALTFDDTHRLIIDPTRVEEDDEGRNEQAEDELPYWRLLFPDHMLIEVGPGPKWRRRRSD